MGGGYIEEEWVQAPPEGLVDVGELVASEMFQGDPLVDDEDFGFEDDFDFSAELPAPQTHKQRRLWRKLGRGDIEVDEYLEAFTTFGAARPMPPVRHPSPQEASLLQEISALEGRIAHLRARLNQRRAPLTSKQKARLSVLSDRLAALRTRIERYGACGYGYCSQEAREVMGGVDEVEHEAFGVYVDMPPFTHPVWVDDEPCKAPAARPSTALVTGASTGAGLVIGITAAVFIMGALAKGFSGK